MTVTAETIKNWILEEDKHDGYKTNESIQLFSRPNHTPIRRTRSESDETGCMAGQLQRGMRMTYTKEEIFSIIEKSRTASCSEVRISKAVTAIAMMMHNDRYPE